nr:MAG TPA: hypothetical protein [Bacteriophage sp.]
MRFKFPNVVYISSLLKRSIDFLMFWLCFFYF